MKYIKSIMIMLAMCCIVMFNSCICGFAAENYKINNTTLEFNKIVYVSPNGNDDNGNGTMEKPFQSLYKCLDYLNSSNLREEVAVVMDDGDYDFTKIVSGYYHNVIGKFEGMKVSFISKNLGKSFIHADNGLELLIVEKDSSWRINFKFYGLIFHNVKSIDQGGYTCLGGDSWMNEFYNCVFLNLSKLGGWNRDVNSASIKVQNCLFVNCAGSEFYSGDPLSGSSINSVSTNTVMEPCKGTKTNCITNATVDSNYNITVGEWKNKGTGTNPDGTVAHLGVYGGEFAWDSIDKEETIVNKAYAKGDNTNNAFGSCEITFKGVAETRLNIEKTADVKEVWVGDMFNYTVTITNAGDKTAKSVIFKDIAPKHIDFLFSDITSSQGSVDSTSTSKNILVNVGDIEPGETITIKIPVNVVL